MAAIHRVIVFVLLGAISIVRGNDKADFIETLLNQPSYNRKVHPGLSEGLPTVVSLNFYVQDISDISEVSMDYSISVFMRQLWQDKRLAFTQYSEELILNYDQLDRLWVPDLFVKNEKKSRFHDITVPNRLIKLYPNGTVYYSQRLTLTLSCDMMLADYPMDVQECAMELESYGYTTSDIIFKWKAESPVQVNPTLTLPEFHLDNSSIVTDDCTQVYITGSFTCQVAKLRLVRQFQYYLVQTYIPTILIVILSWVSFWIDATSVPARISLALLTVLTMTTQSSSISSRLPRVSYVKAIDIWMTACLSFVFGALIEYSIVNYLYRRDVQAKARKNLKDLSKKAVHSDRETRALAPIGLRVRPVDNNQPKAGEPNVEEAQLVPITKRQQWWNQVKTEKALFVDTISRFIFPAIFLIFNIAYWSVFRVPVTVLYPDLI